MTPEWTRLQQLATATEDFSAGLIEDFPDAVRRYLTAAIAPGTPLASGVRLKMRGSIRIRRWLPFRARQLLVPHRGTIWQARVAGVISGSDRYVAGSGGMDWKLLGLVTIVHENGDDVSRSTAQRAAGEAIWVPTALVQDVSWTQPSERIVVEIETDGHAVTLENETTSDGLLRTSCFQRWGDPDNTGSWGLHPFGVEVSDYRSFDGVAIPSRGRAGWHFGTDRWEDGVFFRFEITDYELLA